MPSSSAGSTNTARIPEERRHEACGACFNDGLALEKRLAVSRGYASGPPMTKILISTCRQIRFFLRGF